MAVATASAGRLVTVVLGAGFGGAYLYNNSGNVGELFSELSKTFIRHMAKSKQEGGEGADSSWPAWNVRGATETSIQGLQRQVERMASEMHSLLATARGVTVVHAGQNGSSGRSVLLPLAFVAVVAGGGYLYYKGIKLSDIMYVSRRSFKGAVAQLGAGLDSLSSKIAAVKQQLHARLEAMGLKMEEGMADIRSDVSSVDNRVRDMGREVAQVHRNLQRVGDDVAAVQALISGLELKLDGVALRQDFTNKGIYALCEVAGKLGASAEGLQPIQNILEQGAPRLAATPSPLGLRGLLGGISSPGTPGAAAQSNSPHTILRSTSMGSNGGHAVS
eukprot:jgi/Mesvir1/19290/Mv10365-RA.1